MNHKPFVYQLQALLRSKRGRRSPRLILAVVVLLIGYVSLQPIVERWVGISLPHILNQPPPVAPQKGPQPAAVLTAGEQRILDAFARQRSGVIVQATAIVEKILNDDNDGDRHQKCILRLSSGHSLLLAHNIDLAQRVPFDEGDHVEFRGEYEYSRQGGVIHWTHHDPRGRHTGGWVKHQETVYK